MAKNPTLSAQKRTTLGRKVKKLRRDGLLPANIFGKKVKSQAVTVNLQDFQKTLSQVGETGLVDISLKGESKVRPTLISNVQIHPVSDQPVHADFHQVDLTQKVTANVPLEVIGESIAVKDKGAVLITLFDEIEVEALPADLPDKFTVDISSLKEFNDSVLAKDLKVDRSKVEVKMGDKEAIVMVQQPKEEEEETPPPTEEAEEGEETPEEDEETKKEEGKQEAEAGKETDKKPGAEAGKPATSKEEKPANKKGKK